MRRDRLLAQLGGAGLPAGSRRAIVSCLARRRVSAWALPRPSATASARLAKTTVSQSQTVISQANTLGARSASTVVKTEPTSTMNITGLRHSVRGSSLRERLGQRGEQLPGIEQAAAHAPRRSAVRPGARASGGHVMDALRERAEREGRQVGQGDDDQGDADEHPDEQRLVGGQRARVDSGTGFCPASEPARREHEDDRQEAAEQHRQAERGVVPGACSR